MPPPTPPDPKSPPTSTIDRHTLGCAIRRIGLAPVDAPDPATACTLPNQTLVVGSDGSCRSCEFARQPIATDCDPRTAWHGAAASLRAELANFRLPAWHCGTCADWLDRDLYSTAPPVLALRGPAAEPDQAGPQHLVARLGTGQDPHPLTSAPELLAAAGHLTVELTAAGTFAAAESLIAAARSARSDVMVQVRLRSMSSGEPLTSFLARCRPNQMELVVDSAEDPDLDQLRAVTSRLPIPTKVLYQLTPDNWFTLPQVVAGAEKLGLAIEPHLLGFDGQVPVAQLHLEDLCLVRDFLLGCWQMYAAERRPKSLSQTGLDDLIEGVRQLLSHGRSVPQQIAVPPGMPAAGHALVSDERAADTWWRLLLEHRNNPAVASWARGLAASSAGQSLLKGCTGLRLLLQWDAVTNRHPASLEALAELYGNKHRCRELSARDATLAAAINAAAFGGPWAERLGIGRTGGRSRPFQVGPARAGLPDAANITVIVPSYQHAAFIESTLRSVLAQEHTHLKVLVADDSSSDKTVEVARGLADPRIEVTVNPVNLGLGNSVLKALERVTTPYVALLNSDDLLHPEHLSRCCAVLDAEAQISLVASNLFLIDERGGELTPANASLIHDGIQIHDWAQWFKQVVPQAPLDDGQQFGALLERNYLITSSNLVARTDWLRSQAPALKSLKYCLDWRLFLEAALTHSLRHLPERLVAYRLHRSNTVWFQPERRVRYHLEVNRVAAEAIVGLANRVGADAVSVLANAVSRVAKNPEATGLALFLQTIADPLELDHSTAEAGDVQKIVESISQRSPMAATPRETDPDPSKLAQIDHDNMLAERARRRWMQQMADTLQRDLHAAIADRNKSWAVAERRQTETAALERRVAQATERGTALQDELVRTQQNLQAALTTAKAIEDLRTLMGKAFDEQRRTESGLRDDVARLQTEAAVERARHREELSGMSAELTTRSELAKGLETRLVALDRELHVRQGELDQLRALIELQGRQQAHLTEELTRRTSEALAAAQQERTTRQLAEKATKQLLESREFAIGNLAWNRSGFASLSRHAKSCLHRGASGLSRMSLRLAGRQAAGSIVVATTWQWPTPFHTFVYEEILSLRATGLPVRILHWDNGVRADLHQAYRPLASGRVRLHAARGIQIADRTHLERTRPERMRSFLEDMAKWTGRSTADLWNDTLFLHACTFTRTVELSKARYLHGYFFYDMSFMVMHASRVLGIPYGITCYADHMLDDYPLKLAKEHMQRASLVVATSRRIAGELEQIAGKSLADKLLVKPNGVDGSRFPPEAAARPRDRSKLDVLSVSRFEPKKGLEYLVDAVASLRRAGIPVTAHLVGRAESEANEYDRMLKSRILDSGHPGAFVIHGFKRQEQLLDLWSRCHTFVAPYVELPSGDKDGIPTALIEAMASGMPVVATDAGSIPEALDDGIEGLIVPQRDAEALAAALRQLYENPEAASRMGANARSRFERELDSRVTDVALLRHVNDLLRAGTS